VNGNSHILCDPRLVASPDVALFDPEYYRASGALRATAEGRGSNYFITGPGGDWVLRHYRRGGLVGKVLYDRYLGLTAETGRSWREWRLLARLYAEGLPVPRPVAARFVAGCCTYAADLITEEIKGVETLSRSLGRQALPGEVWGSIGRCVQRFHRHGVYHADLNAHNILIGGDQRVYLIDFDRGAIRTRGRWQERTLHRLQRSLLKLRSLDDGFAFTSGDWSALLQGYHAGER